MTEQLTRRTKIVATIGPACDPPGVLARLLHAGVDVCRLNFSHGAHAEHRARVEQIRAIEADLGRPICILQDLQGPKIRTGRFADPAGIKLVEGQTFRLTVDDSPGDETRVGLTWPELVGEVEVGQRLLLNDGLLELRVERLCDDAIETVVRVGGPLSDHKGINVPEADLSVPALSEKDLADLDLGAELGVDWVALSFVRHASDVIETHERLGRLGSAAKVMAKIEKPGAVERFEEILAVSDGIMVARGDLGVEMPEQEVPVIQKRIIRRCVTEGKPVVVATQMLESMTGNPHPTRAEASDVANAIYDGADAVMLSAETSVGRYPVDAVDVMRRIALVVESSAEYEGQIYRRAENTEPATPDAVCASACHLAEILSVELIACFTWSGATARRLARYRPPVPIAALTPFEQVARQLAISWGIIPRADGEEQHHDFGHQVLQRLRSLRLATAGHRVVIAAGVPAGADGKTNLLLVREVEDE